MNDLAVRSGSVNIISICSGGGGLDLGVELAIPCARPILYVERECFAVAHLVAAMQQGWLAEAPVWSDVTTFRGRPWRGLVDGLIGGIPCFAPGTMVLSRDGYRPIEELRVGDFVLTHKGRWRKVTSVMSREGAQYREVRAQGCAGIVTTDEHPFLAVERQPAKWDNSIRGYRRQVSGIADAKWVNAADIGSNNYVAQVLPPVIAHELSSDLLWVLGRFLADGWVWDRKVTGDGNPVKSEQGRTVICCAERERNLVAERIGRLGVAFNEQHERTVSKFYIADQRIWTLARQFGRLAHGKRLPGWCLELEPDGARELLEGYLSGDGTRSINRGRYAGREVGTVSKSLAYGIALLVQRAYGIVAGVKTYKPAPTKVIEGRIVNQRQRWVVSWYERGNRSAYIADGYGWKLVRSNRLTGEVGRVHNISVHEDESYVADGAVVHNCQPWSLAGKRAGTEDERDLWSDARRIIVQSRPWFVLIENVRGMLSAQPGFDPGALRVRRDLQRLGFNVEGGLFTAAEVGASHERERVFILGVSEFGPVGLANTCCAGSQGSKWGGSPNERIGSASSRSTAKLRSIQMDDSSIARGGRLPVQPRGQDEAGANSDRAGVNMVDAKSGCEQDVNDSAHAQRLSLQTLTGTASGSSLRRGAKRGERSSGGHEEVRHLFPPGPSDEESWRAISHLSPELLPAVSRHNGFRIEIGNAIAFAHGNPEARDWLDEKGPFGLRSSIVQEIAQSTLRRLADGVAESRTDWLRLFGNGVVPLEAGYALRTLVTRLAARGSSGASRLVRLMEMEE